MKERVKVGALMWIMVSEQDNLKQVNKERNQGISDVMITTVSEIKQINIIRRK